MKDLPKSVHVGIDDYEIELMSAGEAEAREKSGESIFTYAKQRVRIREDLPPTEAAATLFHELLHLVWHERGIRNDDSEERVVAALERGMAIVWRENPEVMRWIHEGLAGQQRVPLSSAAEGTVSREQVQSAIKGEIA